MVLVSSDDGVIPELTSRTECHLNFNLDRTGCIHRPSIPTSVANTIVGLRVTMACAGLSRLSV